MNALLIFLGGGLGAVTRWGLSSGIQALTEKSSLARFPLGILTCNVLGCFLIGYLFGQIILSLLLGVVAVFWGVKITQTTI